MPHTLACPRSRNQVPAIEIIKRRTLKADGQFAPLFIVIGSLRQSAAAAFLFSLGPRFDLLASFRHSESVTIAFITTMITRTS